MTMINSDAPKKDCPETDGASALKTLLPVKWVWLLFAVQLLTMLMLPLSNEAAVQRFPQAQLPAEFFLALLTGVYSLLLLKIFTCCLEMRYNSAAAFGLFSAVLLTAAAGFSMTGSAVWKTVFSLLALAVSMVAGYSEFSAHAVLLRGAKPSLSAGWRRLWLWYAVSVSAIAAAAFFLPYAAAACLVPMLCKLALLWKTARVLRA